MIEIFKTNIGTKRAAERVVRSLKSKFSDVAANVDLADCDKVLRLAGITSLDVSKVKQEVVKLGYDCELLA